MNELDLQWLTGIYEGEGCTFINKTETGLYLRVSIVNNDKFILDNILGIIRVGAIHKGSNNKVYEYIISSNKKAKLFCRLVYPLLRTSYKKHQIEEAWRKMGWEISRLEQPLFSLRDIEYDNRALDLNWVAGIYEGEGGIVFRKQKVKGKIYDNISVDVRNNDITMLNEVHNIIRMGYIYKDAKTECSRWRIWKKNHIRLFCRLIYPLLRGEYKRKQIEREWKKVGWDIEILNEGIFDISKYDKHLGGNKK